MIGSFENRAETVGKIESGMRRKSWPFILQEAG